LVLGRDGGWFPSFDDFYLAMLDYNRLEISYLKAETQG
jgi:hypothetical protein